MPKQPKSWYHAGVEILHGEDSYHIHEFGGFFPDRDEAIKGLHHAALGLYGKKRTGKVKYCYKHKHQTERKR